MLPILEYPVISSKGRGAKSPKIQKVKLRHGIFEFFYKNMTFANAREHDFTLCPKNPSIVNSYKEFW